MEEKETETKNTSAQKCPYPSTSCKKPSLRKPWAETQTEVTKTGIFSPQFDKRRNNKLKSEVYQ